MADFLILQKLGGSGRGGDAPPYKAVALVEGLKADEGEQALAEAYQRGKLDHAPHLVAVRWDSRVEKIATPGPPTLADPPVKREPEIVPMDPGGQPIDR